MKAQRILVTGGAGYIGSHTIIELLSKTPYEIISIDNYANSSPDTYRRIKKITGKELIVIEADLCDKKALDSSLSPYDNIIGVIHFAALKSVPESMTDPIRYYQNNIDSVNNILQYALNNQINHFIFSSSCSVYGNASTLPVTEKTPLQKSVSPYGHTKQVNEEMIEYICRANSILDAVVLRYFNPVGAHMSGEIGELPLNAPNNLVPIITQTAAGKNSLTVFGNDYDTRDGSCIRDYVHVSDIADAHVKALEFLIQKKNHYQISLFNLGTGKGVSVLEAIQSFEKVSGIKLAYTIGARREGDVVSVYSDSSLVKKELGWSPKYSLDDMMASAWKWQQHLDAVTAK
jgi:UDP-glucose 4-epimerase